MARTPKTTVLLRGELGSETQLVARAIHETSARAGEPFASANCVDTPGGSFESELCGRAGAPGSGLLSATAGGTLHLNEIGALQGGAQSVLLQILQEEAWRRSGEREDQPLDVRIVASTRHDLGRLAEAGLFREDLLYRINVLTLPIPPLRERRQDIPLLARHFLDRARAGHGRPPATLSETALERLFSHGWPGNLEELRIAMERTALFAAGDTILSEELALGPGHPPRPARPEGGRTLELDDLSLRTVEERLIRLVLAEASGNRSQAARSLGVNRSTLYNKLRQYGIR